MTVKKEISTYNYTFWPRNQKLRVRNQAIGKKLQYQTWKKYTEDMTKDMKNDKTGASDFWNKREKNQFTI